ncbi:VanW family protein [Metaclostridioides mangenotii]|uniref:Vancomycin resistance protein YoaR n=1 Tax=Metaclostridioides mangenotii TaxID=1540 RepID=A0ABS4E7G8_9FIRM|nr:VanW family protein [Clostridioides mangenotii]MBP1853866.1 vancomycin resistance protein YoaR [Clostridioides mangenotii]
MSESSTEVEKLSKFKEKKLGIVLLGIAVLLIVIILSFNKFFLYNGKIAKNVFIQGVEVSNMTQDQALKTVTDKYEPRNLNLEYDKKNYKIHAKDINLKYDIDGAVKEAYNMTKKDSYFGNVKKYFGVLFNKEDINIKTSFDEAKLSTKVSEIANDINIKMENAAVVIDGGINYKDAITGKEFDVAVNKEAIYEKINKKDTKLLHIKVNLKKPEITLDQVKKVDTVLAQYSTNYGTSSYGRAYNVGLSARKTSDVLLMPGEEFSYNGMTGPSNRANGYKNAPVIVYGKLKQAPGGGVCQTSSTIYNTALFAGMQITEVTNHSAASSYVPRGRDATVSDGGLNLRFKNPYKHPVYVKNTANGSVITSTIYGNSSDKQNIGIDVKYSSGKYSTYRYFKDESGNVIKSEHISDSKYRALNKN